MTTARRIGAADSATRGALVHAAGELLIEEGYAAVTSRRVAARAGLKPQLVHYYFETMDDLFIALVERGAEQGLERQRQALESEHPLSALWAIVSDPTGVRSTVELSSAANHRPAIRAGLMAQAQRFRDLQIEGLTKVLDSEQIAPEVIVLLMMAISQFLPMEAQLGISTGHDALRTLVSQFIDEHEPTERPHR